MIVGGASFSTPTLPFRPVDSPFSTSTPSSNLARSSLFFTPICEGCALLHRSAAHLASFQSLPHSLCVYPGWHPERSSNSAGFPQPSNQLAQSLAGRTLQRSVRFLSFLHARPKR